MKDRSPKTLVFLVVTFIFLSLVGQRVPGQMDSADVEILWTSTYPGHFTKIVVMLKSPKEIAGFQLRINISNPDLMNFHTDSIRVRNVVMRVDTCSWTPPPPHDSTCFKDSIVQAPVRFCHIDTVGSLISNFELVECHGDTGDTSLPDCKWVECVGMAKQESTPNGPVVYGIPPNPNYDTLFKLGIDAFCIPDSTQDRSISFYMAPQSNSFLSDTNGNWVPFRYHLGEGGQLSLWWSEPGDANADSIIDIGDITFLINYLFRAGPRPCIPEAADCNADCTVDVGDVTTLINYLFRAGPPPVPGCWYGKKEE